MTARARGRPIQGDAIADEVLLDAALLQVINQEASQPGSRLDYLFESYIKPIRDFGESWLSRLAQEWKIAPVSVTLCT